jgi:UDP-glucose 6-dehydrogenase
VLQVVFAARGRNLFFSSEPEKYIAESDMIFVSVNTPTKTRGVGSGKAADLSFWEGAARMIAAVSKTSKIVVEKSTVPVKTAEAIGKVAFVAQLFVSPYVCEAGIVVTSKARSAHSSTPKPQPRVQATFRAC